MMSISNRKLARLPAGVAAVIAASAFLAACSSGGASSGTAPAPQVRASVRVEPPPAQATVAATPPATVSGDPGLPPSLPQLPGKQPALSAAPQQRISQIDVPAGTPIATAVAQLGAKLGLTVSVDPSVTGTAHASLHNVTIDEALRELVSRNGYSYQLQGNVLRVVPVRMETRTFPLDYVALSRTGTMSTVVQRRLSSSGGGVQAGTATGLSSFAGGPGAGGGGDVLTAQSVADIWQEIRVALVGIMSSGQRVTGTSDATPTQTAAAPGQAPAGSFGGGATTVAFADGSSLIISPISGLINVTAMPDKLAAVEQFINDFQSSILRQVLIEAKIVEVNLSSTFQFGLDWNVISAGGKYGFSLTNDPSTTTTGNAGNVNFKLPGGSTQINAVLTALNTQGNVSVLSNEKTSALNNQRAIFQVTTDEIFFSVTRTPLLGPNGGVVSTQSTINPQQISVGVVLDVLAQISQDNVLTMDIRPAVTNIDHIETISLSDGTTASAPVIARREGDTIARLRGGETMIIGGLVQTRKEKTVSGVPILKDLPFFGKLFQHINTTETRSELVIFLTPTIISGQPVTGR